MAALSSPRRRRPLTSPRGLGILVTVVALLVFANVSQAESDANAAFRAGLFPDGAELDALLAGRQREVLLYAAAGYGSLVLTGIGVVMVLAGSRLAGRRSRGAMPAAGLPRPAAVPSSHPTPR